MGILSLERAFGIRYCNHINSEFLVPNLPILEFRNALLNYFLGETLSSNPSNVGGRGRADSAEIFLQT